MPYAHLNIKEGFYTEETRSDAAGRWINGDKIRFVTDYVQKIGGWVKTSQNQFGGVCRAIESWTTLDNFKYAALGTNLKLYIFFDDEYWDITPVQNGGLLVNAFSSTDTSNVVGINIPNHGLTTADSVILFDVVPFAGLTIQGTYPVNSVVDANNITIIASTNATATLTGEGGATASYIGILSLTNPFTTTMGSSVVNVADTNHGLIPGDFVLYLNGTPVGGLTLIGGFNVFSVVDEDNYTILANSAASSTAGPGGGTVPYIYEINIGAVDTDSGDGWGIGGYGMGTYDTPRPDLGFALDYPRIWSLDTWGDDLIASPRDAGIYYWTHEENPIINRAALILNAPAQNKVVTVWPEQKIVVALGCTRIDGVYDPMCIRWSDIDFPDSWLPTTNGGPVDSISGQKILSRGNEVIAAVPMRGQLLIATDTSIYAMYSDISNIFAFRLMAEARVAGPNAMAQANGVIYIFGEEQFYIFDGTLQVIKCDVRTQVFGNINTQQYFKIFAAINTAFNEIWWFYPSADNDENGNPTNLENNRYVVYNYLKNIWYFGTMKRTAYSDIGEIVPYPIATSPDGYLYTHEFGLDADGFPMPLFLESGDSSIAERNKFVYLKSIIPDLITLNANIQVEVTTRKWPESSPIVYGPYNINPFIPASIDPITGIAVPATSQTDVIGLRAKGGQVSIKYMQNAPIIPGEPNPPPQNLGAEFAVGQIEIQYIPTGVK